VSPSTLDPASHPARVIADIWWAMLVGSAIVTGAVTVLVLMAVLRRRAAGPAPPDRSAGRTRLVLIGGVIAPLIVFVVLFAVTVGSLPVTTPAKASDDGALKIGVTARQWFWDVDYPAAGFRTANEIHIPVGETVDVELTSIDVVHSFWVPQLNRKLDAFPGRRSTLRLKATRPGSFLGECAEFCGLEHARMGFVVIAQPRAEFTAWLAAQRAPPAVPANDAATRGQQVLLGSSCVYCHTIAGTNASGTIGPDLSHVASRARIVAAVMDNTPGNLAGWILDPQHVKPGTQMPATRLDGRDLQALLAYLGTLR